MKWCSVSLVCVFLYVSSSMGVQRCKKVVDIAMVVDESGSIGQNNFEKIKKFVADIISRFSVTPFGAHFAVVKYSTSAQEVFSLTKYTNAAKLQTVVRNMNYQGGWTYTGQALELVQKNIFGQHEDRKDVPNVLVLFSDGEAQDQSKAVRVAREMKANGVAILCVAIGKGQNVYTLMEQLKQISSKKEYTFKSNINALDTIEDSLVKDMCEAIKACVSKPCQNDGECVDDDKGGYECKCTLNWEGKNCEQKKYCPAASFSKWGCYKTPRPSSSKLLFNRRNDIDWGDGWDKFLETIVCDCGKAAKGAGYRYFCIEYFGECWGYKEFDVTQPHAGATKCWGRRPNYSTCNHDKKHPICVGTGYHGYFYELN